ncbi:hypothetical protein, partial [Enterobacter hormaechei]|uniref:hypothetical protein n=1 Tax=Enterobacter hormaechei TaxID=158836 RepID=UPI0020403FD1
RKDAASVGIEQAHRVQVTADGEQAIGLAQRGLGWRKGGVGRISQAPGQLAGHALIVFAVVTADVWQHQCPTARSPRMSDAITAILDVHDN